MRIALLTLAFTIGCGHGSDPASPCDEGQVLVDGACEVRFDDCGERSVSLAGGGCLPVGVPDDGCGDGFSPDGAGGCTAIQPAAPCSAGTYALPGESTCHPVPCDEPTPSGATSYVDGRAAPGGDGTAAKPFSTLADALAAAGDGSTIVVAGGTYSEQLSITRAVKIFGRCDAPVVIEGTDATRAAIQVTAPAEIHQVSITSAYVGVLAGNTKGLLLDRLYVHDVGRNGLYILDEGPGAQVTLRDSFVEHAKSTGIIVSSAEATIERVAVRDVRSEPTNKTSGYGLLLRHQNDASGKASAKGAAAVVKRSIFENVQATGIVSQASHLRLEGVVVRDVRSDIGKETGWGVVAGTNKDSPIDSVLEIVGSTIVGVHGYGVAVAGGDATIERTTIRGVELTEHDGLRGLGIYATVDINTRTPSTVTIDSCLLQDSKTAGVAMDGASVVMKRSVVGSTQPNQAGLFGDGVQTEDVTVFAKWMTSELSVEESLLTGIPRAGVVAFGTHATMKATTIRCAGIPIDVEPMAASPSGAESRPVNVEDLGGNACGCGGTYAKCRAQSNALEPAPLDLK